MVRFLICGFVKIVAAKSFTGGLQNSNFIISNKMEQWLSENLSKILSFEVPDDLIKYITSIENEPDFNDYMKTLLDFDNAQHRNFFQELSRKKFPSKATSLPKQPKKKISKPSKPQQDFVSIEKPTETANQEAVSETKTKKKTKFVNLYSKEGKDAQVVFIKGRHQCNCEAAKHGLINNCLNCGRIVCKQEGSGPCLFCGTLVCTPEEEKQLNSNTKGGAKLLELLKERCSSESYQAALAHRDKLLDYQRNSEQRTQILDDDSDYFNTNSVWLSEGEREKLDKYKQELHEKKHASRLQKTKMNFDFAGRQIVEDKTIDYNVDEEKIKEILGGPSAKTAQNDQPAVGLPTDRDVAVGLNPQMLKYDPSVEKNEYASAVKSSGLPNRFRVQDPMLLEMSDTGRCLSMHQPWASLLVEGIKMHEGRTWYTTHRGRLWIASTAKPPDHDIVKAMENQYRVLYPDKNFKFPSFYPTGCLLGCVNVDDCLPQEEYQKLYPDGESDSPYVFICSNPISLKLRFPVKGQHKIYTLDQTIHTAALKSLQNMAKSQTDEANAG